MTRKPMDVNIDRFIIAQFFRGTIVSLFAWAAMAEPIAIPLYAATAPGSESWPQIETEAEFGDQRIVRNIVRPTLLPYPADADNNSGTAVIVAPGGGFKFLSIDQEGTLVAQWLNQRGINAFVLKYRTDETAAGGFGFGWQMMKLFGGAYLRSLFSGPSSFPERPLYEVQNLAIADALQAVRLVRERAGEWHVRPDAIGIMGFSAGGAVAHGAAIRGEGQSRPDFVASIYGVPAGSDIPANGPPLFLLAADDDPIVPVQWSQTLHERWQAAGLSSTIRRYEEGGHGFGMRQRGLPIDGWIDEFYAWQQSH